MKIRRKVLGDTIHQKLVLNDTKWKQQGVISIRIKKRDQSTDDRDQSNPSRFIEPVSSVAGCRKTILCEIAEEIDAEQNQAEDKAAVQVDPNNHNKGQKIQMVSLTILIIT